MFFLFLKIARCCRGQGKRGKTCRIDIQNVVTKEAKLTAQFDNNGKTWKALGCNGTFSETAARIHVRVVIPLYLHSWFAVDKKCR